MTSLVTSFEGGFIHYQNLNGFYASIILIIPVTELHLKHGTRIIEHGQVNSP